MKSYELKFPDGFDPATQQIVGMFVAQLDDQLRDLKDIVKDMSVNDLEWQQGIGMNTIGMLLAHLAVVEVFWINVAAAEIPQEPDGESRIKEVIGIGGYDDGMPLPEDGRHPSALTGKSLDEYISMLDAARKATYNALNAWSDSTLNQCYMIEKDRLSRAWTLYHVLEHLSCHIGQIRLLKRLMKTGQ